MVTAAQREAQKSAIERGEDAVYVINHAAACTTLDILNTPIELLTQHYLNRKISVSHCQACASGEHDTGIFSADHTEGLGLKASRWIAAEIAGDWIGAIPTLMVQRHAPEVMEGIGKALTYAAGDFFYAGAKKDAQHWGWQHGFAPESEQVQGRTKELYQHEMKHIAQAFVWTGFSTAIALGTLKLLGDDTELHVNAAAKLAGVSTSFFGVLGSRAAFPEKARSWDRWASEHIATPITRVVSNTLGIEGTVVDDALQKEQDFKTGARWSKA